MERSLEDIVKGWAPNEEAYVMWMRELKGAPIFITTMKGLEQRAQSSRWQSTLDQLSDGLVANLEEWYREKYMGANMEVEESPFKALQDSIAAPSSFAKHRDKGCWVEFLQAHPGKIICHRGASDERFVPVTLLDPFFCQFVEDAHSIPVSSDDCRFVQKLTDSMSQAFDSEDNRRDAFVELFAAYTNCKLVGVKLAKSETDGSLVFPNGVLYCNLEVKLEKGSGGGDPYMQGIAYYIKSLPADSLLHPCFLLELCGTAFSVNGIVNTDSQIICEPLCPTYQLLRDQDFFVSTNLAKLFASLRKNLLNLQSTLKFPLASHFPFFSSFSLTDLTQIDIEYVHRMQSRLVFSAKISGKESELIVKFASRYNRDVHIHCHSLGFAPALLYTGRVGMYTVVVMEKLPLRRISRADITRNPAIADQIAYIASQFKEKGYVHGDMRECNVLYDPTANKVVLIDFDWAGLDGVDVYPPFMNPDIKWPEGASTGKPLRHEHDLFWLKQLVG